MLFEFIFIYLVGILTGIYIASQIEKDINNKINK
tara:strand:- start:185 stop:286 length:102 start_codon:yes stop_codon:yes gene_type:complete